MKQESIGHIISNDLMRPIVQHIQNVNLVVAFLEPYSRAVQPELGAYSPIPSQIAAIHPHVSLVELFHVQVGVLWGCIQS